MRYMPPPEGRGESGREHADPETVTGVTDGSPRRKRGGGQGVDRRRWGSPISGTGQQTRTEAMAVSGSPISSEGKGSPRAEKDEVNNTADASIRSAFGRASMDGKNYDPGQGITISLEGVSLVVEVSKDQAEDPKLGESTASALAQSLKGLRSRARMLCKPKMKRTYKKSVLEGVTGTIGAGDMYALLGPSGAGKTTLLDVISRRKTVGQIGGVIRFDGKKISSLRLKTETAYIQQQDVLLGYFTVQEYILFHAFLKLPSWIPSEQKRERCSYAIEKLGLSKCKNCTIGEPLKRGVSGGERKRVCIALGLLTEPKCLFLDEPTSGLDSHISLEVMRVVRSLSNDGRTVICTIHQPSQVIYKLFDRLIVLQNGQVVYWGEGRAIAASFFESLGFPEEGYDNTAEFLLDVVSGAVRSNDGHFCHDLPGLFSASERCLSQSLRGVADVGSPASSLPPVAEEGHSEGEGEEEGKISAADRKANYSEKVAGGNIASKLPRGQETSIESLTSLQDGAQRQSFHSSDGYANGCLRELWVLISFKARAHFKDAHFLGTRVFCPLIFSLILASFWGTKIADPNEISTGRVIELAGLLFIIIGTNAFMTTFFVPAIMEERPVFIKERHDACYRVSSYVLHKVIIEALANVPAVILFSVPIYFATPLLNHPDQFFFFMLTLFTLNICSSMLALAVASICPSMEIAGALVPAILSLCALAGGFLKPFYTLPVWWQWFSVVDFIAWAYSALMMNQYDGQTWWYCQPPTDISSFLTGGSGEGEDGLSGALSLLGDDGQFDAKCVHTTTVDEFVTLDLNQCLLPVAVQVAQSCFPSDFQIPQILGCETICAPIFGESVLKWAQLEWRFNRWISLAILAGQVPLFFGIFYLATRFVKHESR